jgi:mRNA interferase MazF
MQKTRPCLVVSPDEVNEHLRTVIVAPMTTKVRAYPTRVAVKFRGKSGQVALDQIRAVDRGRLGRKLGRISAQTTGAAGQVLVEMFRREERGVVARSDPTREHLRRLAGTQRHKSGLRPAQWLLEHGLPFRRGAAGGGAPPQG